MRRIAVAAVCLGPLALAPAAQAAPEAVPGELLVRFEPGVSSAERADARRDADVSLERTSLVPRLQLIEVERGQSVGEADRELEADPRVSYAEPNNVVRPATTPNDPLFGSLWGLHNIGQPIGPNPGRPDSDIDAPEAWNITRGSPVVTVAVADTGIAYDHPDLVSRMWRNAAEASGQPGVDDDGNGVADDVRGVDIIDRDTDPRDTQGHGTLVAGTIGAAGGNGIGVTGVAQDVRLMPVRVVGPDGATDFTLAEGFEYAARSGADVVNASLSGGGNSPASSNVVAAHPETLFVVAAGNGGKDIDASAGDTQYPCNIPGGNLLCVGATGQSDQRADFSNYGSTSVDLVAPGTNVLSSYLPAADELPGSFEGFEADLAGRWAASGSWARTDAQRAAGDWSATDSPGGNYGENADSSLQAAQPYDLTGRQGCSAHFRMRMRTESNWDFLRVETSPDGGTWTERGRWSGYSSSDGFLPYSAYLGADGAQTRLRFRLTSDAVVSDDGVYIDDVRVLCTRTSDTISNYRYSSGTSMASSHVAGAAALVKSLRPTATVAQLRADLLRGADPVPGLTGTVTNRRLNAWGALGRGAAPKAPPTAPTSRPPAAPAPALAPKPAALVDLSKAPRSIRVSRRGVFALSFRASTGLRGRASFASARRVRLTRHAAPRVAKLGSKAFRAGASGSARVKLRLSRRALSLLRRSRSLRVKVTVTASGVKSTRTFVLKVPRVR